MVCEYVIVCWHIENYFMKLFETGDETAKMLALMLPYIQASNLNPNHNPMHQQPRSYASPTCHPIPTTATQTHTGHHITLTSTDYYLIIRTLRIFTSSSTNYSVPIAARCSNARPTPFSPHTVSPLLSTHLSCHTLLPPTASISHIQRSTSW